MMYNSILRRRTEGIAADAKPNTLNFKYWLFEYVHYNNMYSDLHTHAVKSLTYDR